MMNSSVSFFKNITQFISLPHQSDLIILLEKRFTSSIHVMTVVADFAGDKVAILMMPRMTRGRRRQICVADVGKWKNNGRLGEINARGPKI